MIQMRRVTVIPDIMQVRVMAPQAAAAAVQQPYLLTLPGAYTSIQGGMPGWTIGREFQLSASGQCTGIRLYNQWCTGGTTCNLRLYRVGDEALLGSKNGVSITSGTVQLLYFDSPVALAASTLYRIAQHDLGVSSYKPSGNDSYSGAIVSLTVKGSVRATSDVYPDNELWVGTRGEAMEPIIAA